MDSTDLLARENEFKKLNKQLEKKTESLMKEIENAMQKQDIFSDFSGRLTFSPTHKQAKQHCCSLTTISTPEKIIQNQLKEKQSSSKNSDLEEIQPQSTVNIIKSKDTSTCCVLSESKKSDESLEFLYAFVSVSVKDNILPQSLLKGNITVESVCKFLSSKVKLMQEQIDNLQATINKKKKQCESHMTQLAELESERMGLLNKANNMKSETADVKAKNTVLQNKLNEKDRLYKEQRSVTDKLTVEMKHIKSKNVSLEARCAAQEELIAKLRQDIDIAKMAEKEIRDSTRNLSMSHVNEMTRMENKIKALTTVTDRQTTLIENLKKQNALLQTEGVLRALEKDYSDFLNQDM